MVHPTVYLHVSSASSLRLWTIDATLQQRGVLGRDLLPTSRVYSTTPIPQISTGSAAYPVLLGPPSYMSADPTCVRSALSVRIAAHLGRHIWQAPASSTQQPLLAFMPEHGAQAEIGDFKVAVSREEQILRLEISVSDAFIVYECLSVSWRSACPQAHELRANMDILCQLLIGQSRIWRGPLVHRHQVLLDQLSHQLSHSWTEQLTHQFCQTDHRRQLAPTAYTALAPIPPAPSPAIPAHDAESPGYSRAADSDAPEPLFAALSGLARRAQEWVI